ncbi:MAG: hypothetical protein ACI8PZ_001934 [Myxococcota bacterium]
MPTPYAVMPRIACLVLLAACGGPPSTWQAANAPVWAELGLPPADAERILWSDAEVLTVEHASSEAGPLAGAYAVRLEAAGFRNTLDVTQAPFEASRWAAPDGTAMDLAVVPRAAGGHTVHLTRVPGVVP